MYNVETIGVRKIGAFLSSSPHHVLSVFPNESENSLIYLLELLWVCVNLRDFSSLQG